MKGENGLSLMKTISYNQTRVSYKSFLWITAEIAGHTIKMGNKKHYLLANVALVGESIMLAMRTHFNVDKGDN